MNDKFDQKSATILAPDEFLRLAEEIIRYEWRNSSHQESGKIRATNLESLKHAPSAEQSTEADESSEKADVIPINQFNISSSNRLGSK
jgi:hypothetical protein